MIKKIILILIFSLIGVFILGALSYKGKFSNFDEAFLFIEGNQDIFISVDEYKKTLRLLEKWEWGDKFTPEDEKFRINRIQKIANVDDQLIVYEQVDKEEINTGEKTTEVNMGEQAKPRILFKPDSDPEQIKLDTMKALNTSFNFEKDGRLLLKPEAFSKFAAEATGQNLNVQSPKTVEEHNNLQAIYATYLEDPNNLQDQFRNQKTLKIFDLMVGEPEEFMNMLSSALAEDDPDKRRIGIENLAMSIAQKMILAEDLLSGKVRDYRDLP